MSGNWLNKAVLENVSYLDSRHRGQKKLYQALDFEIISDSSVGRARDC